MKLLILSSGLKTAYLEHIIQNWISESTVKHTVFVKNFPEANNDDRDNLVQFIKDESIEAVYYETPDYDNLLWLANLDVIKILNHTDPNILGTYDYQFHNEFDYIFTTSWEYYKKYRYNLPLKYFAVFPGGLQKWSINDILNNSVDVAYVGSPHLGAVEQSCCIENNDITKSVWGFGWSDYSQYPSHPTEPYKNAKVGLGAVSTNYIKFGLAHRRLSEIVCGGGFIASSIDPKTCPAMQYILNAKTFSCKNSLHSILQENYGYKQGEKLLTSQSRVYSEGELFLAQLADILEN